MPATSTDPIAEILKKAKTIAVVGLSPSPLRPSHGVSAYMQAHGYRIIPVNPRVNVVLGEKSYSSIAEVPEKIDVVNIFRRSDAVPEIVDQAIQLKVPTIWMQETVVNDAAAQRARASGIFVVMDRCILKEHRARFA
jgi:predicted CoA-binding protein